MNYKIPEYLTIHNMDCMDLLKETPDNFYDLAITDPPYGINAGKGIGRSIERNSKIKKSNWDESIPSKQYFTELQRVSKNQIIWGGNYFLDYLNNSRCLIFWFKPNTAGRNFADGEIAWTSFDSVVRQFKHSSTDLNRFHPTQKPVALYTWLLQNYAKPNQKILDTHLGSGSIAIAIDQANKIEGMNLTLTACELDKDYYNDAMNRISEQCDWQPLLQVQKKETIQTKLL